MRSRSEQEKNLVKNMNEEREWHDSVPRVKIDEHAQTDAHALQEPPSQTALFNMGRPSAQSAKRARAALQNAWWRD